MSKGNQLASGARSATFQQATGESELSQDLKTQSMPFVCDRYAIDEREYHRLASLLAEGEPLPNLTRLPDSRVEMPERPFAVEHFGIETQKPAVGYEGQPVGDSVLVTRVEKEHSSNLVLPDSMKAKSEIGYIVAVGEKVTDFKAGQMVMWDKFASHGADIELMDADGVQRSYLLLKMFDILMGLKKVTIRDNAQETP